MTSEQLCRGIALALGLLLLPVGSRSEGIVLELMGDIDAGGDIYAPYGISRDARTIFGRTHADAHPTMSSLPLIWTGQSSFVPGPVPVWALEGESRAASTDGSIIAISYSEFPPNPHRETYRWTAQGGLEALGDLPGGNTFSYPNDISADGSIIVGSATDAYNTHAVRWTEEDGWEVIPVVPITSFSSAAEISADGTVIAGSATTARGTEIFIWSEAEGPRFLGELPGGVADAILSAMSDDGKVIAGRSDAFGGSQPCIWSEETGLIGLGHLPGTTGVYASVHDLTFNGKVAFGTDQVFYGREAFVWDHAHGLRSLREVIEALGHDLSEWNWFGDAAGVAYDGRTLTGYGLRFDAPAGVVAQGWRLKLPPACRDLIDNDGDLLTDVSEDSGCLRADDLSESPNCSDGIDNDGDGRVDHPADPGCAGPSDGREANGCGSGHQLAFVLPALTTLGRLRRPKAGPA